MVDNTKLLRQLHMGSRSSNRQDSWRMIGVQWKDYDDLVITLSLGIILGEFLHRRMVLKMCAIRA